MRYLIGHSPLSSHLLEFESLREDLDPLALSVSQLPKIQARICEGLSPKSLGARAQPVESCWLLRAASQPAQPLEESSTGRGHLSFKRQFTLSTVHIQAIFQCFAVMMFWLVGWLDKVDKVL